MVRPSFRGRSSASPKASAAARGSSKKRDTRCEVALRKSLHGMGLRFRKDVADLPGRPDVVFRGSRVVVFCDGDFWHGRHWNERKRKLAVGSNADYWTAKIERNMARDRERTEQLMQMGWFVIRIWEKDILEAPEAMAGRVAAVVQERKRAVPRLPSPP